MFYAPKTELAGVPAPCIDAAIVKKNPCTAVDVRHHRSFGLSPPSIGINIYQIARVGGYVCRFPLFRIKWQANLRFVNYAHLEFTAGTTIRQCMRICSAKKQALPFESFVW
jgi:hypothetical protein